MSKTIYTLNYNNYFNRQLKVESSLSAYLPYQVGNAYTNINFNENDGVEANATIGGATAVTNFGNYALLIEGTNTIISRWFIIEAKKTRVGQYILTLRRDVLAEYKSTILSAPCFVEKGYVPITDSAILNPENMTLNQIKTSETLLKDITGCPWLVGYFAKTSGQSYEENKIYSSTAQYYKENKDEDGYSTFQKASPTQAQVEAGGYYTKNNGDTVELKASIVDSSITPDYEYEDISTYPYYNWSVTQRRCYASGDPGVEINIYANDTAASTSNKQRKFAYNYETDTKTITDLSTHVGTDLTRRTYYTDTQVLNLMRTQVRDDIANMARFAITQHGNGDPTNYEVTTLSQSNHVLAEDGKIIKYLDDGEIKYKRINVSRTLITNDTWRYLFYQEGTDTAFNYYYGIRTSPINYAFERPSGESGWLENCYQFRLTRYYKTQITFSDVQVNNLSLNIDALRTQTVDAVYDMFAIPYTDDTILGVDCDRNISYNMVNALAEQNGSNIYDIQLLPYCPMQTLPSSTNTKTVKYIKDGNDVNRGVCLCVPKCKFEFYITYSKTVDNYKIENITDIYRIVSGNYNGQFEFSVAKNKGISQFKVQCTYKPYDPYIRVAPDFKGLYGNEFNDARGLIVNGDWSIPMITDSWTSYEISNKNYQNIFNRQIENMDVNYHYEMIESGMNALTGTLSGTASGYTLGIGGAIAGGLASLGGGIADQIINAEKYKESKDYTTDLYNYNLQNVQALPDSISKTTPFTNNNKIFPILEYYTCTAEEKQALRDKIKYNGMSIGRIGTLSEFIESGSSNETYVKGQIIRIDVNEDFHFVNEIGNEVNKGFFIKGE